MDKQHILDEIIRTAKENGDNPLGVRAFEKEAGIKESDWRGKYWRAWGDALREAGYEPNIMQPAYDEDLLVRKMVSLIQELGRFPTRSDVMLKSRQDRNFPSHNVFRRRFGRNAEVAKKILDYAQDQGDLVDVVEICRPLCKTSPARPSKDTGGEGDKFGFVYLIKSGRYHKIGRSNSAERREYELKIQLPEKAKLVHKIKTDDLCGIEEYWHKRFADKHKNGEWYELSSKDVKSFRRRKFM